MIDKQNWEMIEQIVEDTVLELYGHNQVKNLHRNDMESRIRGAIHEALKQGLLYPFIDEENGC